MERKISVALSRKEDGTCEQVVVLAHVNKTELAKLINESQIEKRKQEAKYEKVLEENNLLNERISQLEKEIKYLKGE